MAIVAGDFDADALRKALADLKVKDTTKDTLVDIDVGTVDLELGWWVWKEKFTSRMENKRGAGGIPLVCVIRENKPPGWTVAQATSEIERLIYKWPNLSCIIRERKTMPKDESLFSPSLHV